MPIKLYKYDALCVPLTISLPKNIRDDLLKMAAEHNVSVGAFLVPHIRRILAHEHEPHEVDGHG